jgi:hypothetical protein
LDRLGRSVKEVLTIADGLHDQGVGLRILTGTLTGTYSPTGEEKFFFVMMDAFAELERDMIRERTMADLAAARAGRANGESPTGIAKAPGVSPASTYRYLHTQSQRETSAKTMCRMPRLRSAWTDFLVLPLFCYRSDPLFGGFFDTRFLTEISDLIGKEWVVHTSSSANSGKDGGSGVSVSNQKHLDQKMRPDQIRKLPLVARICWDRVFYAPAGERRGPTMGRPPRHGDKLVLRDPATRPAPACATEHELERFGTVDAVAFGRMHPKLESRGGFKDHQGPPPLIEGTVVGLKAEHLPGNRDPKPLWLWESKQVPDGGREMDHWWSMYLRRFDIEHTFRFLKQDLGWTRPHLREPGAADRWTWIVLAAHTLLRLTRPLAAESRLPWQQPLPASRITPGRVRASYRRACRNTVHPANPPLASHAGPGRPRGGVNRVKPVVQPVGLAHYKG